MVKALGTRAEVWHGTAEHTSGGLRKKDLMFNKKSGRIVSKVKHDLGKKLQKEWSWKDNDIFKEKSGVAPKKKRRRSKSKSKSRSRSR